MKKIPFDALRYRLSEEEFKNMVDLKRKGIIAYKISKNDNLTALALVLKSLIPLQSRTSNSQSAMFEYQEANILAAKCLEILEPIALKQETKNAKKYSKKGN